MRHWKRWQRERRARVIQDDLVNLERVKEISQLDLLASVLPDRVGSPLSINNLREDLPVAFETADRWVTILENLYVCFDSRGRELDFVVVRNGRPEFAVECKTGDGDLSRNVSYFAERTNIPLFYQVHLGERDYELARSRARVLPFTTLAALLTV